MIDKHITDEQRQELDSAITLEKVINAMKTMFKNKSTGPDGIPIEFYEEFMAEIAPKLRQVLNHIYMNSEQPTSHATGYIKLIFKKGIKYLINNWRAITLLNVDHKLLTKIITTRLRKVMPHIIDEDQTCGIPERQIFDNLYLIRDIIDHAKAKMVPT